MKKRKLGTSNLMVSPICLGCMSFGDPAKGMHKWTLPEEESLDIIKYALDQGINFFDTAMGYQGGSSEEYLGKAIKRYAKREDVVIATKFLPRVNLSVSVHDHILSCLDASLKRLDMDYVDLYILHMWDYKSDVYEVMKTLHECIQSGKVRYIGISNAYGWQVAKANEIARANGFEEFISIQGHYNLIFREEEREMLPCAYEYKMAYTPYSSLASGRLAKHPGESSTRLEKDNFAKGKYDGSADIDLPIIKRVEELAENHGVSMSDVSLAWLLTKVTSPIIGATKVKHIDDAVHATSFTLTEEEIKYLEELYQPHELVGVMKRN